MKNIVREIGFDIVVAVTSGLAMVVYMLGVLLEPLPTVALGGALVFAGTVTFVPRKAWVSSGILGAGAVIIAGILIPRFVVEFTTIHAEISVIIGLSVVILFGTFVLLHLSTFRYREPGPA